MPVLREIRVHGVSGTTPESMLDVGSPDDVARVAGDDTTGFWVRTAEAEGRLPPWMRPPMLSIGHRRSWVRQEPGGPSPRTTDWRVEAYSWGALTSGARGALSRAGWLLLTPFALANIASWARPALALPSGGDSFGANRSAAVVVRLAGLGLTLLLVTGAATVSIDLVAFQCFRGGDLLCPSLPSQAQFLASPGWEATGRRVAMGAVGPLLVLALLWLLGRATVQRYEDVPDRSEGTDAGVASGPSKVTYPHLLEATAMWNGRGRWRWLSSIHLLGGLGATLVLTGWTTAQISGTWDTPASIGVALGSFMVLLAVAGVVVASDGPEAEGPRAPDRRTLPDEKACRGAQWLAGLAAVLAVAYLVWVGVRAERGREFVDLDAISVAMTVLVLLIGVGVALGLVMWRDSTRRTWPARVAVVGPLLAAVVAGVLLRRDGSAWWPVVVLVGLVIAIVVHMTTETRARRAWGFRGAGPGVLLGAGLFVALLFTTSAVVGVVVWLAGPANLTAMPSAYTPPALCPDQAGERTGLNCSTVAATGDAVLIDGSLDASSSPPVISAGRLSVGTLEADSSEGDRTIELPSLSVTSQPITVVLEGDGLRQTSTTPGARDTGTYDVPEQADGTRTLLVEPGVLIEVRVPPYVGEFVVPDAIRSYAAIFPYVLVGALGIGAVAWARSQRMTSTIEARVVSDIQVAATTVPPVDLPSSLREKISSDAARYRELVDAEGDSVIVTKRERLVRSMSRLRRSTALTRRGETLLAQVALVAGAAMVLAVVNAAGALLSTGDEPDSATPARLDDLAQGSVSAGMYLCVGAAIGLVALGSRVHRDSAFRRPVGILWDLSCFWPRVAHPFSPPCYAERAVPDLYERLQFAVAGPNRALLSGHSLGSFLCVAAIFRLRHDYGEQPPEGERPRANVALLTYGSQLRYYWGRVFAGAFGPQVLGTTPAAPAPGEPAGRLRPDVYEYPTESKATPPDVKPPDLAAQLDAGAPESSRWMNLYRLTDALGFTVLGDDAGSPASPLTRNWLDRPVSEVTLSDAGDPTPPTLLGHSDYPRSSDYHQWAWNLVGRVFS